MQAQSAHGIWELLVLWLFAGSNLIGLPPGERDAALMKAIPPQSLVYFEWSGRGPGQAGAKGIDGFAADLEIQQFFTALETASRGIPPEVVPQAPTDQGTPPAPNENENSPAANHDLGMFRLIRLVTAHPGCIFVGFEPPPGDVPGLGRWLETLKGLHGGLIITAGDDAESAWQGIVRELASNPEFHEDPQSATQTIPMSIPGYQLVVHREDRRILFALGQGTLPRLLEGLSGQLPGLDSNTRLRESLDRIPVSRLSTLAWFDVQGTIAAAVTAMGPLGGFVKPLLTMASVDAVDHAVQISGVNGDTMVQRTFIATNGRTDGMMVLTSGQPIQTAHLNHIPADADLVIATSLSLKNLFRETRKTLAMTQPLSVRVFDEAVKQIEAEIGLKLADDVLPAFGDVITVFDSPSAGGMIATSLVASLEVQDLQKAAIVFDRVMVLMEQALVPDHVDNPDAETFKSLHQTFLGSTIHYFQPQNRFSGARVSITPTFCLTSQHLLFAVHPQAMKAQLRLLEASKPSYSTIFEATKPGEQGEVLTYVSVNGPRAFELIGAAIPYLSQSWIDLLDQQGIALDSFHFPSTAAISPYFGNAVLTVTRQKKGLLIESTNFQPVVASLTGLYYFEHWNAENRIDFDEVRRQRQDQVVPAVAETEKNPAEKPEPSAVRKLAPIFLKALIPDQLQSLVPEAAYRKLEEGPSEETRLRREDAKKRREERRRRRLEQLPPP